MPKSFYVPLATRISRPVSHNPKSGQALAELVVSLLAFIVIIAALLQIGLLGYEQTQTMLQATENAHRQARLAVYVQPGALPEFIFTWNEGQDGAQYSVDDLPSYADIEDIYENVLDVAQPAQLNQYVPGNAFSLTGGEEILETSSFVMGYNSEFNIPILPAVRSLMYEKDAVDVDSTVYMIWTKGLY